MKEPPFFAREEAICGMTAAICEILAENSPTIYLYGSCVLDDFRFGWSDIDLLVLTQERISPPQAQALVTLRQKLSEREMDNPYYRFFEGGMLTLQAFLSGTPDCVVYWGTSGQRITDTYLFDSFCMAELLQSGRLVSRTELRNGAVTSKTAAAQWAMEHNLCPVPDALEAALRVRKNPMAYRDDLQMQRYTGTLGPDIQRFADVLEQELLTACQKKSH